MECRGSVYKPNHGSNIITGENTLISGSESIRDDNEWNFICRKSTKVGLGLSILIPLFDTISIIL